MIHASYVQWFFFFDLEQYFNYDPTAPTTEDVQVYGTLEATKRGHARFVRKAASRIRSGCCRGYEDCCRDIARLNDLEVPLERALLTYDILVSSLAFGFWLLLTFVRNLIYLSVSISRNALRSLVQISNGTTTHASALSSWRKSSPISFNLFRNVIQIRLGVC